MKRVVLNLYKYFLFVLRLRKTKANDRDACIVVLGSLLLSAALTAV